MRKARAIWMGIVGQFERSGLTQEAFAEERAIPVATLRSWIYRLRREQGEEARDESSPILPVRMVASTAPTARQDDGAATGAIELVVGSALTVRFPMDTPPSVIAEVLVLLHGRC